MTRSWRREEGGLCDGELEGRGESFLSPFCLRAG